MEESTYDKAKGIEADIRGFGIVLLEIVTGVVPYDGSTPEELKEELSSDELPKSFDRIMDEQLKNFVLKCLKNENTPTAEELLQDEFLTSTFFDEEPCETLVTELPSDPQQ